MSGGFTTRKKGRTGVIICSVVVSLVTFLLVAGTPTTSDAESSASCSTSFMALTGRATNSKGAALKQYDIAVVVHDRDAPLDRGVTNKRGGFKLEICKTRLASAARRHAGHVNFDVLVHVRRHRGPFYVKMVTVPYGNSKANVPGHFRKARTVKSDVRSARAMGGGYIATGVAEVKEELLKPAVMRVQAAPMSCVQYNMSTDSVKSVTADVGVTTHSFGISGELTVGKTASFGSGKQLCVHKRHKPAQARIISALVNVTGTWTCVGYNPYVGFALGSHGSGTCYAKSSAAWDGRIGTKRTPYISYRNGKSAAECANNRHQLYWAVGRGSLYKASAEAHALGQKLSFTTEYNSGTYVKDVLDQNTKRKQRFCVSGNDDNLVTSSALYLSNVTPPKGGDQPCPPLHGGSNGRKCRPHD